MAKTEPSVKVILAVFDVDGALFRRVGALGRHTGPALRRMGEAGL
jgi:hypothetical protein